ncbi:MAG TPA: MarR family winged helix-turn-helix transcriptional regulator [Candidatus Limnocylindrales bacterium]
MTEPSAAPAPSERSRPSRRDAQLAPWRAFLRAHARVERRLDEDLRSRHGLSLQEYETLLHLAESPARRLRMGRLADSLLLSKSGVTRLVDRLVDDGLVERTSCASDARGAEATLTGLGLARLRAAAPTHLDGIREHFFGAIAADDLAVVERAMDAISEGLCDGAAHCDPALHGEPESPRSRKRLAAAPVASAPSGVDDRLPAATSPGR